MLVCYPTTQTLGGLYRKDRATFNLLGTRRVAPSVGYNHLISNKYAWNNCFIKVTNKNLPNLADSFYKKEQKAVSSWLFLLLG